MGSWTAGLTFFFGDAQQYNVFFIGGTLLKLSFDYVLHVILGTLAIVVLSTFQAKFILEPIVKLVRTLSFKRPK